MTSPGSRSPDNLHRWIPVRSLGPRHRPRIERHLLGLDTQDRYWRFGYNAGDERIRLYVRDLDFERDELFGVFNRRLEIVALAHLAYGAAPLGDAAPGRRCRTRPPCASPTAPGWTRRPACAW